MPGLRVQTILRLPAKLLPKFIPNCRRRQCPGQGYGRPITHCTMSSWCKVRCKWQACHGAPSLLTSADFPTGHGYIYAVRQTSAY